MLTSRGIVVTAWAFAALLCIGCTATSIPDRDDAAVERLLAGIESERPAPPELTGRATLADYLAYAGQNNPGLRAARARWQAALERVEQVSTLPDPTLVYGLRVSQYRPQAHTLELMQMVPWFGKLDLAGQMALQEAETLRHGAEAERLAVAYRVKSAYYEYYYLSRALAVVQENRDLAKYLEAVAQARYRTSAATHQDVIRAQVELGKMEDEVRSLTDLRGPAAARLNAALGRAPGAELAQPVRPAVDKVEATDDQVLAWARQANPELLAMNREVAKNLVAAELAKKNYYPDFTVGGGVMREKTTMGTMDSLMVSFGITLPIWLGKYHAAEREAAEGLRAAAFARKERENGLAYDVKMALYALRDAERKIELYRDTLEPKAREALKANETAFTNGKADFLDVIDAQRTLLEFQLAVERALTDHAVRLAELEMLVGREVTGKK